MASVTYKSISALQPIELKYNFYKNEELKNTKLSYSNGYTFYQNNALISYQDATINRESVLVLTSAINLSDFFSAQSTTSLGKSPGTIQLQPRNSNILYAYLNTTTNTINLATEITPIFILPIPNTNQVELLINGLYLQVDDNYPYTVFASSRSLPESQNNRQRFECIYQDSFISFKTKTAEGYRYLAFNNDNILRATGVVFNNSAVNDYIFKANPITLDKASLNFAPTNNWVTYYFSFLQELENKLVTINKELPAPTNLLIDFPVEEATRSGKININVANLKTSITPLGSPAPINNL